MHHGILTAAYRLLRYLQEKRYKLENSEHIDPLKRNKKLLKRTQKIALFQLVEKPLTQTTFSRNILTTESQS